MSIQFPTPTVLIACHFYFFISIISLLTTTLAIFAYFKSIIIRQAYQNLLLLNLLTNAYAYTVVQIAFYGPMIMMKTPEILTVQWACSLNGFLNVFCCGMELYTLMCIALERYFAIVKQKPLTSNQIVGLLVFGYCWIGITTRYFVAI
jgi:hypothetical protein